MYTYRIDKTRAAQTLFLSRPRRMYNWEVVVPSKAVRHLKHPSRHDANELKKSWSNLMSHISDMMTSPRSLIAMCTVHSRITRPSTLPDLDQWSWYRRLSNGNQGNTYPHPHHHHQITPSSFRFEDIVSVMRRLKMTSNKTWSVQRYTLVSVQLCRQK